MEIQKRTVRVMVISVDELAQELGALNQGIEYAREVVRRAAIEIARIERALDRLKRQLQFEE